MKTTAISTIDIRAKEWFDRKYDDYYFSAQVTIDLGLPTEKTVYVPFQYAYGLEYLTKVKEQLRTDGILPDKEIYNLPRWCRENDVVCRYSKQDKCLKRDVVAWGSN